MGQQCVVLSSFAAQWRPYPGLNSKLHWIKTCADRNCCSDSNPHANPNTYGDTNHYAHAYANVYINPNTHANLHINAYTNSDGNAHCDANPDGNTRASSSNCCLQPNMDEPDRWVNYPGRIAQL